MVELGVLRVLTLGDPEEVARHGRLIERHYSHVSTLSRCTPDRPDGIPSTVVKIDVLSYIEAFGRGMATRVDVLCINCAFDSGVEALDGVFDIPVAGTGVNVATVASARDERVGTLGLGNEAESTTRDLLGSRLAAEEVVKDATTASCFTIDKGRVVICAAINRLVDAGCDVVASGCTDIFSSDAIPGTQADAPVPVVDPVVAMGAAATTAVVPPRPPRQWVAGPPRWHSAPLAPRSGSHVRAAHFVVLGCGPTSPAN